MESTGICVSYGIKSEQTKMATSVFFYSKCVKFDAQLPILFVKGENSDMSFLLHIKYSISPRKFNFNSTHV
jgi:hypothetical protein